MKLSKRTIGGGINIGLVKILPVVLCLQLILQCSCTDSNTDKVGKGDQKEKVIEPKEIDANLIYLNANRLKRSKENLEKKEPLYVKAFTEVIKKANDELTREIDPVTNKTQIPASGDIHDYHTLGAYYWPDETKPDGLPWIYKDGQFNPINLGPDTDYERHKVMLSSLNTLNLAYYFSHDQKYIVKAREIVRVWFINEETKMNPNVDYGKAIPGKVPGTNFSIIDWTDIGKVVTTIQLSEEKGLWEETDQTAMNKWFQDYYTWLMESEFGILESTRSNNHATNYDYQLLGIMIYLNKMEEASALLEKIKTNRIATQIDAEGKQPEEIKRTKSVNYTVNNLWALARITDLGLRFTNVDLFEYSLAKGGSIPKAYDFVIPFIEGKKEWTWKQITGGGAEAQLQNLALPMFARSELMCGKMILPAGLSRYDKFSAEDVLTYAPSN